jgi:SAM-dependent methyltransferase
MDSVKNIYKNMTTWTKILIIFALLLICYSVFAIKKENFQNKQTFVFNDGPSVYDDFYSEIYDQMVYSQVKDAYEIGEIINNTTPTEESIILDIGCGTGHHVAMLKSKGIHTVGIDNSSAMIAKAKKNYPEYNFMVQDALNANAFQYQSFTHILCMYFTIYYIQDKTLFFNNCMGWLKPGGYLIVHLVDRELFDPILPPANPLLMLTPQRYAKERITSSKIRFKDFNYTANFDFGNKSEIVRFKEKFDFKDGRVKKQEHKMYMPTEDDIVIMAQEAGFILHGIIDLIKSGYEYNYLYIFTKPN